MNLVVSIVHLFVNAHNIDTFVRCMFMEGPDVVLTVLFILCVFVFMCYMAQRFPQKVPSSFQHRAEKGSK